MQTTTESFLRLLLVLLAGGLCYLVFKVYLALVFLHENQLSYLQEIRKQNDARAGEAEVLKANLQRLYELHDAMGYEIHALAAHFVPRLRREYDVTQQYFYEKDLETGDDLESTVRDKLEK